ncbi:hypothetical protein [Nonomuraea sp. NPDC049400]|uniref:hypothetical protein n=1 Tax=Nonomuraea sp. NPDC049400 TaxID=3364352 RepID=UPI00379E7430
MSRQIITITPSQIISPQEAHLLATRLVEAAGNHTVAFPVYERELRPYITENQSKGMDAAKMSGA